MIITSQAKTCPTSQEQSFHPPSRQHANMNHTNNLSSKPDLTPLKALCTTWCYYSIPHSLFCKLSRIKSVRLPNHKDIMLFPHHTEHPFIIRPAHPSYPYFSIFAFVYLFKEGLIPPSHIASSQTHAVLPLISAHSFPCLPLPLNVHPQTNNLKYTSHHPPSSILQPSLYIQTNKQASKQTSPWSIHHFKFNLILTPHLLIYHFPSLPFTSLSPYRSLFHHPYWSLTPHCISLFPFYPPS